ncbi:MAG: DUF1116 domain-containing protein [Planctomycetota bacterium]|jgi:hypothetical protein|nr:DUF1116 domain-containing protein [Planctomycetota bacterium]
MSINELFGGQLGIVNVGAPLFRDELIRIGVDAVQVDWKPAGGGDPEIIAILDRLTGDEKIAAANEKAVALLKEAHPFLVDVAPALKAIPGMTKTTILHAGPPIGFSRMCGAMKGAVAGAIIYEGLAKDEKEALAVAESGDVLFSPCHHFGAVGPMAGVVSASMPVHVVQNRTHGNLAFATINEGLGKVLRFGANGPEVIDRLRYIEREFAPVLKEIITRSGPLDLKNLTAQALHMGDECHNRNKASTSLFIRALLPHFMALSDSSGGARKAAEFLKSNEHYFLNLSMAACKSCLDAAHGVPHSTVVTTMARNGVDFGIRVSGMGREEWFTGPARMVRGLLFPGFSDEDANPDLGDSAITETMGIGGFAMGAAPAIVQFVGGTIAEAIEFSTRMYSITVAENPGYSLPPLDFRGSALGIDIRAVLENNVLPVINTGIAHRKPGVGQIGAGIVNPPEECFVKALRAYSEKY